jgi:hypothetical protein
VLCNGLQYEGYIELECVAKIGVGMILNWLKSIIKVRYSI